MEQSQTIYSVALCQGPSKVVGNPLGDLNSCPGAGPRPVEAPHVSPPAMPNGRCRMYGGASTGPRTAEGLARMNKTSGTLEVEPPGASCRPPTTRSSPGTRESGAEGIGSGKISLFAVRSSMFYRVAIIRTPFKGPSFAVDSF